MSLNIHQLHIFYTVAERGSFSAAAQTLHMTQPAVTMQIQALEERFGVKLLHRSTKKLELTEAGHCLLPQARKAFDLMKETDFLMAKYVENLKGRLNFAASLTIGEYVLPRLLGSFLKRYPEVLVSMQVMNTSDIVEAIANQGLAFGLVEASTDDESVVTEPVMNDELMLIVPSSHPFASREEVALKELIAEPLVLRERGSGTRQVLVEELARRGVREESLRIVSDFGSNGAVKSAVQAGLGLSVLSVWSIKNEAALGLLKPVRIQGVTFQRQFYAVRSKSSDLPMQAEVLLDYIRGLSNEPS
ncbi:selenium metabolism-associated LysR family transcriptional regulator [Cohnella sp. AR92]|uniref:selenium metabolism-associated LysR family transcriptional regulator n=1 Tax=Cohnella sp. AR92 TaxID=648716 RepID=UPI000F8CF0A9|nr:selenium metabolism-associated LysR family transcriptional regulator [Cohnella sp. AR92]RUS46492.1 LysR family transcriptional regulator [Cohnella sp. AR92]